MTNQPSPTDPAPALATRRPSKQFAVSASIAGVLLLGIGGLLIAEGIKSSPKMRALPVDYIPGAAIVASWVYYVQRPKTATEMRWNCAYLSVLAIALMLIAYAIKPNDIGTILLYWALAVISTAGAPLLIVLAIILVHQWVCAKAAAGK